MIDVVALGELLIDFTCIGVDGDGYPAMQAHPGGAPANFLAALSKFGAKTALLGKVGTDVFGKLLLDTLHKAGIETSGMVMDDKVYTTLAFVTLDETGNRDFSFSRKPGADTCITFDELDLKLIDEAKVFHFGTLSLTDEPSRSATYRTVEYAKEKGKLITFDPNLRKPLWKDLTMAKQQMLWGLDQADVVKISDDEADFLFGMEPEAASLHILNQYHTSLVFVTCGARDCHYRNIHASGWCPTPGGIVPVDTTGAGDIFGGSALWKILSIGKTPDELRGDDLADIVRFACTSASLSTTKPGGISSVPDYARVIAEMR